MGQAYLILAHTNLNQLELLIDKLTVNDNIIVIHIDAKINSKQFSDIKDKYNTHSNIYFLEKRVNCIWGDFSIVDATCKTIDYLLKLDKSFTHAILLSGMDYPIKNNSEIDDFFKKNIEKDFIEFSKKDELCYRERYNIYYFKYANLFKNKIINNLVFRAQYKLSYFFKIKRNHPVFSDVYFGSQWWILSNKTLKWISKFIKENPKYIKFYKNTNIPDEFFFHTILANNKKLNITNDNMHFMIWESNAWHPSTLTIEDKVSIMKSDKLFARKFDINIDSSILEYINKVIK